MLAAELALAEIDVAIVERRTTPNLTGSRAGGLHARTIEVFDMRGIADRFLSKGQPAQVVRFQMVPLDISDFPTRHPYGLALWQNHIERILAAWVEELGVTVYRGREVTDFKQDEFGVDVAVSDGDSLRAEYLVGCDGGRSLVRKKADIDFPGWDPTVSWLIAEVEMADEPVYGLRQDAAGTHGISRVENGGPVRVLLTENRLQTASDPTFSELREALIAVYGTDYGVHSPTWLSRFTDVTRQAAAYRKGRILLAGDAAHVHPPIGGQGLNIGVQDAVNLGWKLAQVLQGTSTEDLLDTYESERQPVAARVLKNTMAQVALCRTDDRTQALNEVLSEVLAVEEPRKRLAAEMSGLGVRYDLGEGHPLLGRRMPDLDLSTAEGAVRVFTLLHKARPVLLNFGEPHGIYVDPRESRVQLVNAQSEGPWELPEIGVVKPPSAVLVRPDGYVAWVGDGSSHGLAEALDKWFGKPVAA
jgi:3-(3-hydroxy-phenyl)propionate hydroxylase